MSLAAWVRQPQKSLPLPNLKALVQSPGGRILLWLCACALLYPMNGAFSVPVLLALVLWKPAQRNDILCLGSPLVAYELLAPLHALHPLAIALAVGMLWLVLYLAFLAARNFEHLPSALRRHPQLALHGLLWLLVLALWQFLPQGSPAGSYALALVPALGFLVWRIGYLLLAGQRGSLKGARFRDHAYYLLPAFGGSNVPFGKGHDSLAKARVDDPAALAACQLSGLKLLVLAWLWKVARKLIDSGVHGKASGGLDDLLAEHALEIPPLAELMLQATQADVSLALAWPSLLLELLHRTLTIAIFGHVIIGTLRLFGYKLFRNTYKPLLAPTIIEFWNRFYYYFKELLVEFFFYPTYLSVFKTHPRLRIFAAVMASACLGNLYYHFLRDLDHLYTQSLAESLDWLASRGFYSLLLALGIFVSMLREKARRQRPESNLPPVLQRLDLARRIFGVWLFYALIHIWSIRGSDLSFAQRGDFFLSLFGMPPLL